MTIWELTSPTGRAIEDKCYRCGLNLVVPDGRFCGVCPECDKSPLKTETKQHMTYNYIIIGLEPDQQRPNQFKQIMAPCQDLDVLYQFIARMTKFEVFTLTPCEESEEDWRAAVAKKVLSIAVCLSDKGLLFILFL